MYMPSALRTRILKYLFENGVMVVSSVQSGTHEELNCLNIYPFQLGRSLASRGFVKRQYAWSHAYFTLTDEGIEYLRGVFGAPANVKPATLAPRKMETVERREARPMHRGQGMRRPARGQFHKHE